MGVLQIGYKFHVDRLRQTNLHQVDIVLYELHFIVERHQLFLIVVEHMAQHIRELLNGTLRPRVVDGSQRIDIVQRVEQEMGIDL